MVLLKKIRIKSLKGFTLTELLVSITIMVGILGITISGGPEAIMRITLNDNTYQTEILIREAQLHGGAINSLDNTFGGAGIFFDLATSTKVLKFRDRVDASVIRAIGLGNGLYDHLPTEEKDTVFSLVNGHHIGKLCVASSTSLLLCNSANIPEIKTLTISFSRPKQNANIYINGATSTIKYVKACIQMDSVRSPEQGYVRSIFVYNSGMITKKVGTCN